MITVSLSEEDVENLWDAVGNESDGYRTVEILPWNDQGKYQFQPVIIEHLDSGGFYQFNVSRSGSYFTDYEYNLPTTAYKVKKIERTIFEWVSE